MHLFFISSTKISQSHSYFDQLTLNFKYAYIWDIFQSKYKNQISKLDQIQVELLSYKTVKQTSFTQIKGLIRLTFNVNQKIIIFSKINRNFLIKRVANK